MSCERDLPLDLAYLIVQDIACTTVILLVVDTSTSRQALYNPHRSAPTGSENIVCQLHRDRPSIDDGRHGSHDPTSKGLGDLHAARQPYRGILFRLD